MPSETTSDVPRGLLPLRFWAEWLADEKPEWVKYWQRTMRKAIRSGKLRAHRTSDSEGGRIMLAKDDVAAWRRSLEIQTAPSPFVGKP